MIVLVNKAREEAGAPPLLFSQELELAAQRKADAMAGGTIVSTTPSRRAQVPHTRGVLKVTGERHI